MEYFDGTLAGAFYTASRYRKALRLKAEDAIRKAKNSVSLDAKGKAGKADDGDGRDLSETISEENTSAFLSTGEVGGDGNDILTLYDVSNVTEKDDLTREDLINGIIEIEAKKQVEKTTRKRT